MQEEDNQEKQINDGHLNECTDEQVLQQPTEKVTKEAKITPDTIMKMEDEKKEFEKEHNIYHIHYNINGDAQINAGEIYGNMSQDNRNTSEKMVNSMEDVRKMFGMEKTLDEFQMLIVLCILNIVPVNHFITLVNKLKECWIQDTEEKTNTVSPYISTQEIFKLGAEQVVASFYDESGELEISCFHLKSPEIATGVKHMIWVDYPVIRNYIVQWMFQIVQMKEFRNLILSQVGEAFQDLASLDYNFTKTEIINVLLKRGKSNDYYFLNRIMERLLETKKYKENAINLMKHWCTSGNTQQKTMVYSLYHENRDKNAADYIRKSMKDIIQRELHDGELIYDETSRLKDVIFSRSYNINLRILQENDDVTVLYAQALMGVFQNSTHMEKKVFGFYFCYIFMLDFFYVGYPRYQMLLVKLMYEKETRQTILPLYRYVWEKKVFRDIMGEILNFHLVQLWEENHDWTYTNSFFRTLSFSGKKKDFDNTEQMLFKMERKGNTIAGCIRKELHGLLKQRMAEKRRDNNGKKNI